MIFALLLFLVYFGIGLLFVLGLFAIQIAFGNSSELDPQSIMVRLFSRNRSQPEDSARSAALKKLHRHLEETNREILHELLAHKASIEKLGESADEWRHGHGSERIAHVLGGKPSRLRDLPHTFLDELTASHKGEEAPEEAMKETEATGKRELAHAFRLQ